MNASTALPASRAESPLFWATLLMNSCLVNGTSSYVGGWGCQTLAGTLTTASDIGSTMRICGAISRSSEARKSGRSRTACAGERVGAALLAVDDADRVRRPAGRPRASASTASIAAPPEVTTSSTRQTHSPSARRRLRAGWRCRSPSPALRTIRNGSPPASDAAAASATAPSSGRREPHRLGLVLGDGGGDRLAERAEQVGPRLEAVLVEVVLRAALPERSTKSPSR